ncbi:MAG: DNA translocase FtsK [Clostridia bacterium]|nr:DNA translocase FtsK [Clostridia bacterium]
MAKRRKKSNKKSFMTGDVAIVVLIILSILLGILIYAETGTLGKTLGPLLGGIMGFLKYLLPVATFGLAIYIACDNKEFIVSKFVQVGILLISIAIIMTTYQISTGHININSSFSDALRQGYELGTRDIGGGALGALVSVPLVKTIGGVATTIVAIGALVVWAVYTFGIKPSNMLANAVERAEEKKEEKAEERARLREERLKQREERKHEKEAEKQGNNKDEVIEDQITINMGIGKNAKGQKIYEHDEDLIPNNIGQKKDNPEELENLFKQEQETKEEKTKEVLQLAHTITVEEENYEFPPIELLNEGEAKTLKGGKKALTDTATKLQKTLYSFGVSAKVENVSVGPAITRYELKPAEGVRVSKIANLADDIALNLAAESIRIEAPIPGKNAVGIEIPNKEKEVVNLRDIIDSDAFNNSKSKLSFALGKNVAGEAVVTDIAKMPHVLIAGSTGSGKSVCINTLIASIIYKAKPSEVKLVMVDPKVVELSVYNGIPHLLIPVVTDPKKAAGALAWAVQEMVNRYGLFAAKNVRDIKGYNEAIESEGGTGKLPQIVIIIDELADLMMVAKNDVEDAICRLAQMARAAGMHLVIATQRPSVDVITGLIKANIPSRIAFAVSSGVDSRTILDSVGAENLLGKGDMLFAPVGVNKPTRIQGAFVSDKEVEKIVDFLKSNGEVRYDEDILESIENANKSDKDLEEECSDDDTDPFLMEAIETVVETGQASTSFIQRRFKVGYARAGRIMDQMEQRGIISGYQGSKPREVLMSKERWAELKMAPQQQTSEEQQTEE